ncbi:hypothetical protein PNEG_03498 [Pneumocystis murina B123]|uniref:Uncharacterized protein n=1 Tax=Pneumocystis murina (strain B123) TaxID=1069680 RepID=M7NHL3_PNEMU|nr:hypothetical protein PNEG_03498 [Pneumocystis murina B123]EMR08058.1 hypothetical protein PNEG_03498 [Pneumocystis murina B123]
MDQRFPVDSDPRFIRPKKRGRVVLDSRFSSILDPDFSEQPVFDLYGRRLKNRKKDIKDIESLYILPSKTCSDSNGFLVKNKDFKKKDLNEVESLKTSSEESIISLRDDSFSSEEDLSSDFSTEDLKLVDPEPEIEIPRGEMTYRLAVVNLDWDHIRSVDIFAALGSFVPKGGRILSVKIYPSEFGKKRMEKEDVEGPPRDIFSIKPSKTLSLENKAQELKEFHKETENDTDDTDNTDDINSISDEKIQKELVKEDKGNDFNMTQLRKYQLERLRYYYAIVVCDSVNTAKYIYKQCDGREYEASANFFDLRFVPDEESFDSMQIRDECLSLPEAYVPEEFVTDALKHSNVKLMWDNDDPVYLQMVKRAFSGKEINENDFKVYLASTDSEASDIEVAKKYRSLLLNNEDLLNDQENVVGDMQVTFMPGLDEKKSDEIVVETTLEKYKRKEKERKKKKKDKKHYSQENGLHDSKDQEKTDLGFNDPFFSQEPVLSKKTKQKTLDKNNLQKAQLELLMMDDNISKTNTIDHHLHIKDIRKFKKKPKSLHPQEIQDNFDIDLNDPRFSAMYSSHHFDIDPTNPRFKKTHSMIKIIKERQRRHEKLSLQ